MLKKKLMVECHSVSTEMKLALLSALFSSLVTADPRIFWLNNYSNDSLLTTLKVENGANLYLASNDLITQLQNIKISTGISTYTLDQLSNGNSVKLISDQLIIQSAIDPPTAALLTGFLYATTKEQANDNTFSVTVVNGPQTLVRKDDKSTTVVLNTYFTTTHIRPFDAPMRTTYVTQIEQFGSTNLNFHYGYPEANWKTFTYNQFFENPQFFNNYDPNTGKVCNKTRVFFDSVQPIQVNLPYWYITAEGPFNLNFDSTYDALHTHNTTSSNTTGAFVLTDVWQNQTVNLMPDRTREGTSGVLITTHLKDTVTVTFITDGNSNFTQNYNPNNDMIHAQVSSPIVSNSLQISATALRPGTFYCQYFFFTGDLLPIVPSTSTSSPTTTTTTSTTTTVVTTTKSSTLRNHVFTILIFFCTLWQNL